MTIVSVLQPSLIWTLFFTLAYCSRPNTTDLVRIEFSKNCSKLLEILHVVEKKWVTEKKLITNK